MVKERGQTCRLHVIGPILTASGVFTMVTMTRDIFAIGLVLFSASMIDSSSLSYAVPI